ncbi:hypothetical protein Tco_0809650 [Tanacetum coccineum]
MDDPNITMKEYIRLEEEKAQRRRQTFNWQTAMFEKVVNYEDEDECSIDFETEFPAIVFDNTITSEPTVCPPNENEVDFRISLDESDDEDYMSSEGDEITHGENGLSETIHDKIIKTFETGRSGSEVEDGIFWRGAASIRESCLEETVWDPSTFGPRLGGVRRRMTWRQFILALGLHTEQEMAEAGFGAYWDGKGRKSRARLSGGHFIGRLAMHFGLVSDEGLRGLQVTWVALGPERKQGVAAGAYEADKAGQVTKEVALEILAPAQAPSPPPPALQPCTMSQMIERVEEEVHHLRCDVTGLRGVVESFTSEQSKVSTWLISCMTQLMDASGQTYQPFDSTLVVLAGRQPRIYLSVIESVFPDCLYGVSIRRILGFGIRRIELAVNEIDFNDNTFNGMNGEDVTVHIARVLEITEWIKIHNVEKNILRLHVFSRSLSGDAEKWWNDEIEGNPSVGMKRVISSIINITPYPIPAIVREYTSMPIPAPRDIDNLDELCRTEEFTVVRHSIRNDEEFVTVSPSKICVVERTPGSMSFIYHELFSRKERGWEVTRTK